MQHIVGVMFNYTHLQIVDMKAGGGGGGRRYICRAPGGNFEGN